MFSVAMYIMRMRAYFALTASNHACFSDFCDVSAINREFLAFPSVNIFKK